MSAKDERRFEFSRAQIAAMLENLEKEARRHAADLEQRYGKPDANMARAWAEAYAFARSIVLSQGRS